jgi:hypothetical protein
MDFENFHRQFSAAMPVGTLLVNPGGGVSEVLSCSDRSIGYRRGHSRITVSIHDLYQAYRHFSGQRVSSADLRRFSPGTFDSKKSGHSCNCTLLFMALQRMGNPYNVLIEPALSEKEKEA